jgi:hypothetical protein
VCSLCVFLPQIHRFLIKLLMLVVCHPELARGILFCMKAMYYGKLIKIRSCVRNADFHGFFMIKTDSCVSDHFVID